MSPPRRPGGPGRAALAAALAATLLAACGSSSSPPQADPATVVPAGAPLYIGATVRPGGQLGAQSLAVARVFTRHQQPFAGVEATIDALAGPGQLHARHPAVAGTARRGVLHLPGRRAVAERRLAQCGRRDRRHVRPRSRGGVPAAPDDRHRRAPVQLPRGVLRARPVWDRVRFVGPFVVIGVQAAVNAVIDTHAGAPALSASATFAAARRAAPPDTVAELHVGSRALVAALPAGAATSSLLAVARAVVASSSIAAIDATLQVPAANSLVLTTALTGGGAGPSSARSAAEVFAGLPGDSCSHSAPAPSDRRCSGCSRPSRTTRGSGPRRSGACSTSCARSTAGRSTCSAGPGPPGCSPPGPDCSTSPPPS